MLILICEVTTKKGKVSNVFFCFCFFLSIGLFASVYKTAYLWHLQKHNCTVRGKHISYLKLFDVACDILRAWEYWRTNVSEAPNHLFFTSFLPHLFSNQFRPKFNQLLSSNTRPWLFFMNPHNQSLSLLILKATFLQLNLKLDADISCNWSSILTIFQLQLELTKTNWWCDANEWWNLMDIIWSNGHHMIWPWLIQNIL